MATQPDQIDRLEALGIVSYADGERFATTGQLGPKGEVLVFQSLYKTALKGSVVGALELASDDSAFANAAALSWLRPALRGSAPSARCGPSGLRRWGRGRSRCCT